VCVLCFVCCGLFVSVVFFFVFFFFFFFSSRRRHTRFDCDWSSDVCSSDLTSFHKQRCSGVADIARLCRMCRFSKWLDVFALGGSDRKSTRLNSSHSQISYAVFCLKKKKTISQITSIHSTLHTILTHTTFLF